MRRHIGLALLTAALSVLLTGCLFRSTEDLYALPERFPGYEDLTGKRSEIQAGLEMEYGTTVETAVIYSGDNTSVIQFQDMDGDGSQETAVISFRIPGAERSLRVYFLTTQGDTERYEISAVVEGDGTGINAIDYVEPQRQRQKGSGGQLAHHRGRQPAGRLLPWTSWRAMRPFRWPPSS